MRVTRQVWDVVQRLTGAVGGPTPVDFAEKAQLVYEGRSLRSWEERDERVIRWSARFSQAAVAAQFSFGLFTMSAEGSVSCPKGTVLVLDGIVNEQATSIHFGWADSSTVNPAGTPTAAAFKDNREGTFLGGVVPLAFWQGTQAAGGTTQLTKFLPFDRFYAENEWGYIQRPVALAASGTVLYVRTNLVNETLTARAWGRLIYPK